MTKNIKQLFDEYMFECEFKQGLKPKTLLDYKKNFTTFITLSPNLSLETLSPETMSYFFETLQKRKRIIGKGIIVSGVKKSTIATYVNKLNCFFNWLKINGYIKHNPFDSMKRTTPRYDDKQFLKKEEAEKILAAIIMSSKSVFLQKRNLLIFNLLLYCGLRREELLLLQVRDLDLQQKLLSIRAETSKVPRTRYIPLHSQVIMSLQDYLKERMKYKSQYLIVSANKDQRLTNDGLDHLIAILCQVSGVKFHVHQFRHTFAVNFLKSSNNVAKLQQLLGHKDASMTLKYVRCLPPNEMRKDIEIMQLDSFI